MPINKQDSYNPNVNDADPAETAEWRESLADLTSAKGPERAREIMGSLLDEAGKLHLNVQSPVNTDYINTISATEEPEFPGDEALEREFRRYVRWNAGMVVQRAQKAHIAVGGHLSTYASAASLYEVGFNHFFRGQDHPGGGDHIFFQGHASPGMYSRAFLEGRLSEADMDGFRQEISRPAGGLGMPSYPHPRSMPSFWQFPTVSMGLGPINAIYQAQYNKYLHNRGLKDTSQQHVWAFLGDGEMDEVESRGQLQVAANEGLDNLTFVINCNLQRLDGPVRGNGKIIQELESFFRGAGWNVIKLVWGREWDDLLARDTDGALLKLMNETPDGDFQTYKAEDGNYVRENFFGRDERALKLVENYSDDEIWGLKRGGHDYRKIYAAYKAATEHKGRPTVILAHTIKGYSLGSYFEGRNATHQMKKFSLEDLKLFRDNMQMPITDAQLEEDVYNAPYCRPAESSEVMQYIHERRRALGGYLPDRPVKHIDIALPEDKSYAIAAKGSGAQKAATTMVFVRMLKDLMRDKNMGKYFVPVIPDEARTFGMDSYFPSSKIYNPHGQNYTSVDRDLLLAYKESEQGVLLHVGINEAGATAAFTAVGSGYFTQGVPTIPIYIFYSMFGFQRTGDAFWAAADQMTRGFILGATAGRTTLTGEGLQHADGHSPLLAMTNPAIVSYDPAYGYEIGHIVKAGIERMYGDAHPDPNVMYYITVYNEPIIQPAEPENLDVDGLLRGMYRVYTSANKGPKAQILASGVAVPWAIEASELLAQDWGVSADVWSVTSWGELRRDGIAAQKETFANKGQTTRVPYVTERLAATEGPIVATSDFETGVPEMIRAFVPRDYSVLGADGFGFSDTRPAARRFFGIDRESVVFQVLCRLAAQGQIDASIPQQAFDRYNLADPNAGSTGGAGGEA